MGIGLPLLQALRTACFGKGFPELREWPIALDAYVTGALLIAGGVAASRGTAQGKRLLAAAWGFAAGIMYRTFFEQLGDPARHPGARTLVLTVKGIFFGVALAGLLGALRDEGEDHREGARVPGD